MNDTLQRIKQQANKALDSKLSQRDEKRAQAQRCAEAAKPLFQAYQDVREQPVKIGVLKQIWPTDYHQRDDRASVLVAEIVGGEEFPRGIRLLLPGGHRTFEATLQSDGSMLYAIATDTSGTRPQYATFTEPGSWLDIFYKTMAHLLEL